MENLMKLYLYNRELYIAGTINKVRFDKIDKEVHKKLWTNVEDRNPTKKIINLLTGTEYYV